jgi:uncharacterized protein YkwD
MKKLALIIFLIPALALAQDASELKAIQILNDYRASKGLPALIINKGLCKAAQYQVKYETLVDSVTHDQNVDLPNFEEILKAGDRIRKFAGIEPPMGGTEITMGYKSKGSFNLCSKKESYINLENYIIDSYKSSKHHDLAMVNPEAHQVGISIFREEIKEGSNIKYRVFCVITFGS